MSAKSLMPAMPTGVVGEYPRFTFVTGTFPMTRSCGRLLDLYQCIIANIEWQMDEQGEFEFSGQRRTRRNFSRV